MQVATTTKVNGQSFSTPKGASEGLKRVLAVAFAVALTVFALFVGPEVFAAVPDNELKPLADKSISWTVSIAIIGIFLGCGFGFARAATTNTWEPAFKPVGIGLLWGIAFGIITLALGAPVVI